MSLVIIEGKAETIVLPRLRYSYQNSLEFVNIPWIARGRINTEWPGTFLLTSISRIGGDQATSSLFITIRLSFANFWFHSET